jgi:hypothetical protein
MLKVRLLPGVPLLRFPPKFAGTVVPAIRFTFTASFFVTHAVCYLRIVQGTRSLKTRVIVRESPIHGLGVFAIENIKYGEVVGVMGGIVSADYDEHSEYVCQFEDWNGNAYYVEPFAPFKYLNHSNEANVDWDTPVLRAQRDIVAGEEITIDYGEDWNDAGTEDSIPVGGDSPGTSCMESKESGFEKFAGDSNGDWKPPNDG